VYDAFHPIKSGVNDDDKSHTTLNPTLPDAKTSHLDAIREALAGLSRDELLGMLADALADGGEPSTTGDNGNG